MDSTAAYYAQRDIEARVARAEQLQTELAEERFDFELPRWPIKATVDGNGTLQELTIASGLLASRPEVPQQIGQVITDAIKAARRRAMLHGREKFAEVVGAEQADRAVGTKPIDGLIAQYEASKQAEQEADEQRQQDQPLAEPSTPGQAAQSPPAAVEPPRAARIQDDDDYFDTFNEHGLLN